VVLHSGAAMVVPSAARSPLDLASQHSSTISLLVPKAKDTAVEDAPISCSAFSDLAPSAGTEEDLV